MTWPATIADAEKAGYHIYFDQDVVCRGCNVAMFWGMTPNGKWQPFTLKADKKIMPHHAECSARKQFAIANALHASRAEHTLGRKSPEQIAMFPDPKVREIRRKENA